MRTLKSLIAASSFAIAVVASSVTPALAQIPIVDGKIWAASSLDEKRAYLVGIANMADVIRALQAKRGTLDKDAPGNRIAGALDMNSINQAITKIDQWYAANPSRANAPVLGVIWLGIVKAGGTSK
jgi:hypothetical protein